MYVKVKKECPTTTTTLPPPICKPDFEEFKDRASIEGKQDLEIEELEECFKKCNYEPDCLAFDYNKEKKNPCYFFYDEGQLFGTLGIRPDVTQFRIKKRCPVGKLAINIIRAIFLMWCLKMVNHQRHFYSCYL